MVKFDFVRENNWVIKRDIIKYLFLKTYLTLVRELLMAYKKKSHILRNKKVRCA